MGIIRRAKKFWRSSERDGIIGVFFVVALWFPSMAWLIHDDATFDTEAQVNRLVGRYEFAQAGGDSYEMCRVSDAVASLYAGRRMLVEYKKWVEIRGEDCKRSREVNGFSPKLLEGAIAQEGTWTCPGRVRDGSIGCKVAGYGLMGLTAVMVSMLVMVAFMICGLLFWGAHMGVTRFIENLKAAFGDDSDGPVQRNGERS